MDNIFNKSTFFTVDLINLSNLFSSHYSFKCFEILGIDEDNSYVSKSIDNKGLDNDEIDDFNDIVQQGYCEKSGIDLILRKLCYDGFIDSGNYLINN